MTAINKISSFLFRKKSIAPLVVFRIAFGVMMFLSLLRFVLNGWVEALYIKPNFFFPFYGFEWIKPLSAAGMYALFAGMMACSLFITAGFLYRLSITIFFLLFTYVELIDKSNYLNHYYFISIISLLMIWLPAHKKFSLDALIGITKPAGVVARWSILCLQAQIALVYFFAGIAKINPDWLLHAMPLKIWLPSKADTPVLGLLMDEKAVAYIFSWCGMLFDVGIAFFLFYRPTVWFAFALVVIFHLLTALVFPGIGVFPYIMIVCVGIFLPAAFHDRLLGSGAGRETSDFQCAMPPVRFRTRFILAFLSIHFTIQLMIPLRYLLYPGKLFYTEEGYRFSWRVMLMEKAGAVFFHVKDHDSGKIVEVRNCDYLTVQQEKQMSTQPDMILQFAQHLRDRYSIQYPQAGIYAEAYVAVNGRGSRLWIDPTVNLADKQEGFFHKNWILSQGE